jgi:glycerol-3-phosphate acyltransferase PlsX
LVRIALDAMGGDSAPRATVEGALLAARELDNSHIVQLVGEERTLRDEMERVLSRDSDGLRSAALRIEFVDAAEVITMSDKPASAVRGKPDSSMVVGVRLQKEGRSDAFVSAGNTGAQMAASILLLQLHPSITRPAIGTVFPTATQPMAYSTPEPTWTVPPPSWFSSRDWVPFLRTLYWAGRTRALRCSASGRKPRKGMPS